jgi:hypothetical protein
VLRKYPPHGSIQVTVGRAAPQRRQLAFRANLVDFKWQKVYWSAKKEFREGLIYDDLSIDNDDFQKNYVFWRVNPNGKNTTEHTQVGS